MNIQHGKLLVAAIFALMAGLRAKQGHYGLCILNLCVVLMHVLNVDYNSLVR